MGPAALSLTWASGKKFQLTADLRLQIFVRAFDFEDRLVGLAFLEVTIYVTSLRAVKNLLLLGDAVRSVSLFAFQVSSHTLDAQARPEE